MKYYAVITDLKQLAGIILAFALLSTATSAELDEYHNCVLQETEHASENQLAAEIKKRCKDTNISTTADNTATDEHSPIRARMQIEQKNQFKPFTLMAYKPNFVLAATYNTSGYNSDLYQQEFNDPSLNFDKSEAQFQISIKTPLIVNLFKKDIILYAGYTNRSFWQVYNSDISRPFRETNHEPEIWLQSANNTKIFGFSNRINMIGVSHQSNGRGSVLSRSWNRIYANFAFEKQNFIFSMKLWSRFKESPATDDNPNITDYMGHGELRAVYTLRNNTFSLMSRNNIESGFDKGATELSWSFPFGNREDLRGYIQIFTGYGESLIDYDQSVNRIGVGVSLSDWL
ncbi:Phospholipase A1 @ Outer membrane phospholipase A [hydrothermal vent metagenome]|uniref:Phosphatidylcholine 1-acylhydrolase n=1 Tax=hydrothermal vent metagenome TaxID=652676 RepID=A0A3B0YLH6_9ZZZZ